MPDVGAKHHGYLISMRDMCFECETLVSLPRWALDLICTIYVRLSDACSSQMGPRWSSIFCLEETEEVAGFYFKTRVIFVRERKNVGTSLGISRENETGRRPEESAWCFLSVGPDHGPARLFPYDVCTLLFKLSVVAAEAVSWFYILNLTERTSWSLPSPIH